MDSRDKGEIVITLAAAAKKKARLLCDTARAEIALARKNCERSQEIEIAIFFTPGSAADRFVKSQYGSTEESGTF